MKKIIILFSVTLISLNVIAQPPVRIGNMEIIVRKQDQDTTAQINVFDDPCPPCPSEDEIRPKPKNTFKRYEKSDAFLGFGFIIPNNGNEFYTTLGGNSFNLELGSMKRYYLTRRFALGGTLQYSYYNYRLMDVYKEPIFREKVLDVDSDYEFKRINKEAFRSHNIAASLFTRYYLLPPQRHGKGKLYFDIGAQGEFAASRHYMLKFDNGGKDYYKAPLAFNPFNASAFARIGRKSTAFFFRYSLTDVFNTPKELPMNLPPITVGIMLL